MRRKKMSYKLSAQVSGINFIPDLPFLGVSYQEAH